MQEGAGTVVCFGEALIDFLEEPHRDGGPPRFLQHAGGAPANVAVAIARLGGNSAFVGMLGSDVFGDFLLDSMRSAGVTVDCVVRTDRARTALAFVTLDRSGERRFSFYRPPAADLLFRAHHFPASCFSATTFHACSNSLTETAIADTTFAGMKKARAGGALVSFDVNLRRNLWPASADPRDRIWVALAEADLVKLSRGEFEFLVEGAGGRERFFSRLWDGRTRLALVTDGAAPVRYFTRAGDGTAKTFPVSAIDTTAAGDAFVGGLLFALQRHGIGASELAGFDPDAGWFRSALEFASACGALAVTRYGAFAAMPTYENVQAFLRDQA